MEPFEIFEEFDHNETYIKYPRLKITKTSPSFYLILRGLIGNVIINQTFNNTSFYQGQNYLDDKIKYSETENFSQKITNLSFELDKDLQNELANLILVSKIKCKSDITTLASYLSDSLNLKDIEDVLNNRKLTHQNKDFFTILNNEFCNFYYHTERKCHTIAFLHLYRILEYVSYTFPIMYSVKTKDFVDSFETLKTLFAGDKDKGELKVFKKFIESIISIDDNYKRLTIDIHITSEFEEYNQNIYNMILRICDSSFFENNRNIENAKLVVKFSEFSSFIINIRNRFFHLKNSQKDNIKSSDIIDSEYFFSLINKKCAYFLSLITLEIIKKTYFMG